MVGRLLVDRPKVGLEVWKIYFRQSKSGNSAVSYYVVPRDEPQNLEPSLSVESFDRTSVSNEAA